MLRFLECIVIELVMADGYFEVESLSCSDGEARKIRASHLDLSLVGCYHGAVDELMVVVHVWYRQSRNPVVLLILRTLGYHRRCQYTGIEDC